MFDKRRPTLCGRRHPKELRERAYDLLVEHIPTLIICGGVYQATTFFKEVEGQCKLEYIDGSPFGAGDACVEYAKKLGLLEKEAKDG